MKDGERISLYIAGENPLPFTYLGIVVR